MKKVLYSTTALAAAGLLALSPVDAQAAEKVKLGLGGYYIWFAGASSHDHDDGQGAVNMVSDSEIYVRGNTTLDNGIRVDAIIQFETDQVSGGIIDESYLKVGNMKQWGEFRLGSTKSAHFLFRAFGPHVSTISNATNHQQTVQFVPSRTRNNPTAFFSHEGGADRMLAMYVTPNLNGFQGGISFTPAHANSDAPAMTEGEMPGDSDNVSVGANYKGKFGDASVGLSGGLTQVTGASEYTTTQFGANVSFAGFSIGGHWAEREDDKENSTAANIEGWMAGIGYKNGPWNTALTWLYTEKDSSSAPGADESNQISLGMTYSLGAGVTVGASVFSIEHNDETGAPDQNNEGVGALGGIRVNF